MARDLVAMNAPADGELSSDDQTSLNETVIMMTRTTIRIQQALLDALKERARHNKRSLAAEMEEVVRRGLLEPKYVRERVELPIFYGGSGANHGVDLTDTSRILELSEDK
jgi:hypothetical protein